MRYPGKFFECFRVGQVIELDTYWVSKNDVYEFCENTGDHNPLHDPRAEDFHKEVNLFNTPVIPGLSTLAWAIGMVSRKGLWDGTCLAFAELSVKFTAPVMPGETLFSELTVIETRDQKARYKNGKPAGVVKFHIEVSTVTKKVLDGEISVLIAKRAAL